MKTIWEAIRFVRFSSHLGATAMSIATMDLESAAKEARGNWQSFDSFAWYDRPDDCEEFAIVYTENRDSDTLTQSNSAVIAEALDKFTEGDNPDAISQRHNHWAVGWVDGFAIRVFCNSEITQAFRTYWELMQRLEDYPILDEEDYSRRESEDIDESWECWVSRDFERELEKRFPEVEFSFPDDSLRELFDKTADDACEYWYPDGSGYSIGISRIAESLDLENLEGFYSVWRVKWNDPGECIAEFTTEWEALEKVVSLSADGFLGAFCERIDPQTDTPQQED